MQPRRVYYTQGSKDFPMVCHHIKSSPKTDGYFIRHWHTQMHIYYVERGAVRFYSLVGDTDVYSGQIHLALSEEVHGNYTLIDGSEYWDLTFSPELVTVPESHFFFKEFLRPLREGKLQAPQVIDPSMPGYDKVLDQFRFIMNADKKAPNYKPTAFLAVMGLCLALMPLCRVLQQDETNPLTGVRGNNVVHFCQNYMGGHYGEKITLSQLAEKVHMHPNYLCKLFKDYTGQTIFEYLTSIRISFATQHIRNSPKPLRKIAEECGFNSLSFFNKKFKLHTGLTPFAYSKLYKNR